MELEITGARALIVHPWFKH